MFTKVLLDTCTQMVNTVEREIFASMKFRESPTNMPGKKFPILQQGHAMALLGTQCALQHQNKIKACQRTALPKGAS